MRKLILALPVAALLLAAGLLFSEVRGAFAGSGSTVAVAPTTSTVEAAPPVAAATPEWTETRQPPKHKPTKSAHQP